MNHSQFKSKLNEYKELIDAEILRHVEHINSRTNELYGRESAIVTKAYTDILNRGGKRLRGVLTMVGYEMCGGKDNDMIVKAALAIEMMHAYILIIDDIQDRSDTRRGGPSAHKLLQASHGEQKWRGDSSHVGMSLSLNAALFGSHSANLVLGMLDVDSDLKVKALNIMNHTMNVTLHGQTNDIVNSIKPSVKEEDINKVLQWKTAHYTFLNPIHMGMVLAGAGCEDTNAITEYALNAGKAFQIADDLLVMSNDLNKNSIDDIREGKQTLLIQFALENTSLEDRKFLEECLGDNALTAKNFKRCQAILTRSGAVEYAQKQLAEYIEDAIGTLNQQVGRWDNSAVLFLTNLSKTLLPPTNN